MHGVLPSASSSSSSASFPSSSSFSSSPLAFLIPSLILLSTSLVPALYLFISRNDKASRIGYEGFDSLDGGDVAPSSSRTNGSAKDRLPDVDFEIQPTQEFYRNLRVRKLLLALILLGLEAETLFRLSWELALANEAVTSVSNYGNWARLVEGVLMMIFWGVCIVFASRSLPLTNSRDDIDRHWSYTVSLTVLTFFALLSTFLRLVLPTSVSILPSPNAVVMLQPLPEHSLRSTFILNTVLTIIMTILQIAAFLLVGTTSRCAPMGKYDDQSLQDPLVPIPSSTSTPYPLASSIDGELPTFNTDPERLEAERQPSLLKQTGNTRLVKPITGLSSCSPLSYLFFNWMSPVLAVGSKVAQLSQHDLPVLGRRDRATNLWEEIRGSERWSREDVKPRGVNGLLWRVLMVNRRLFIWQSILSFFYAFLCYMPAFFLQRLIAFLEVASNRKSAASSVYLSSATFSSNENSRLGFLRSSQLLSMFSIASSSSSVLYGGDVSVPALESPEEPRSLAWGYVFCLGLLGGALLEAGVGAQLWFVSNSMLATRIRVQLNCLVFDKTLKRKDVAGVASAKVDIVSGNGDDQSSSGEDGTKLKDDVKGKTEKPDETEEAFNSKSQVLNLFTIDVDRVADFSVWCFSLIEAPTEIFIGTYFLYQLLGWAAFAGIGIAVLFLPANHFTSKAFASVQDKLMTARDKRVSLMNEVLQSVRMIKYMAFEAPFEKRCLDARADELKHLRRNFLLEVSFNAIWSASPLLCVLTSFYFFTQVMGQDLTPSVAFASLAVWNELRFALNVIPEILVQAIQCLVSLRRIEKYLKTPEVEVGNGDQITEDAVEVGSSEIAFKFATVTWPQTLPSADNRAVNASNATSGTATPASKSFELQDLSVKFPIGKISLVTGALGSGKTLLLLALLGEADVLAGQILCPHSSPDAITLPSIEWDRLITDDNWVQPNRTAFVPQSAWLQNDSIRNNICFGLPFRKERYDKVLAACSLVSDMAILEDGDETEIGEKGINLSGGQKARVSLARAVYSRASILLLDDVLSAVDAHTALHIFNVCLNGDLMQGRTIILVSHHVQLTAPGADYIVVLENGRTKFEGDSTLYLSSFKSKTQDEEDEPVETKMKEVKAKSPPPRNKALASVITASAAPSTDASSASEAESDSDGDDETAFEKDKNVPRKLIDDETRAVGRVSWSVWSMYFSLSGNAIFWTIFVAVFVGAKATDVVQSFWLNIWAASYDNINEGPVHSVPYYLGVYAGLSLLGVLVATLQWAVLYIGTLRVSERLYKQLLHAILRAPLRFFDTQALGRLLNRFGKDFEGVDAALPDHWARSLICGLGVLTTLTVIASVAPAFLLGFGVLSFAHVHYAKLFSKTARELRRLDSVSKSPLYSIYGEAIAGVAVIRAFGSSRRFMTLMLQRCSTNVTFYWYLWSVNRWLSMRFQLLGAVMIALTGFVLLLEGNKIDAALAGFALTYALNISNDMLFFVRRYTALELAMVGVERIKEYSEVEQEAPEITEPRPPAYWPHAGEISVEKLTIRYAPELPNVLHELDFSISAGQKVGIVGATGCGKSTLALSFFRFVEAWSGRIVIDGLDISKVGLKDLRSNLTIIPQDPTILSGTLQSTLDIFGEYEDSELFQALRRCHLIRADEDPNRISGDDGANRSPFYDLNSEVSEGGSNFSQGQRQLLCMARALLKRNKILLLDEATASVDYETDEMISTTIREEFADCTLLVIAHRLRTVIDFDKILVLDAGNILEFDSPSKLLDDPSSRFYALCRASGKSEFRILKKIADGKKLHKPKKLLRKASSKPK